jgi:competence protein ComEC
LGDSQSLALIKALTISGWQQHHSRTMGGFQNRHYPSGGHFRVISALLQGWFIFWCLGSGRTGLLRLVAAKVAAVSALAVAVFYSGLAGFSVLPQRSVVMLSVVMAAIFCNRSSL